MYKKVKLICTVHKKWLRSYTLVHCTVHLKGQSNEIFDLLFFSSFKPVWPTDQWVKIFSFQVSFSPKYSYFSGALRSIILRGVKFHPVSYCAESSSTQYHTARSQVPRSMIL